MIYVFDTSSFRVMNHYFPQRFPSFWNNINDYVTNGNILSVREVFNELERQGIRPHLQSWIKQNKNIFLRPSREETEFVARIFSIPHFQFLISEKNRLKGMPVADPFVIALGKVKDATVVTEEKKQKNAPKIPNVCEYFKIKCMNIEGFMEEESWEF